MYSFKAQASFVVKPVDTEVRIGESTHLDCTTSDGSSELRWTHFQSYGDGVHRLVYAFGFLQEPYNKSFQIEKNSAGAVKLVINNVALKDAGVYICQDAKGLGQPASAQLIVLESDPVCDTNISPSGIIGYNPCKIVQETVELTCGVKFSGNVPPDLQLSIVKNNRSFPIDAPSSPCKVSDSRITCKYTTNADLDSEGMSFTCQSKRSRRAQYQCSTTEVRILYAYANKVLIKRTIGDAVTCSANTSSLDCNYRWVWFDGVHELEVSENNSLNVNKVGWNRCVANCKMRDHQCIFDVLIVNASYPTVATESVKHPKTTAFVIFALATTIALLICILAVIIRKKCTRRKKPLSRY